MQRPAGLRLLVGQPLVGAMHIVFQALERPPAGLVKSAVLGGCRAAAKPLHVVEHIEREFPQLVHFRLGFGVLVPSGEAKMPTQVAHDRIHPADRVACEHGMRSVCARQERHIGPQSCPEHHSR
eukprot:scaffold1444_cov134-Isochrysis_galbana.AAC.3